MAYPISSGIEVSLDNSTWYKLTDHNRGSFSFTPELIESSQRMANGKMRKYVIAKKDKIAVDWKYVPTKTSECVDGNHGPGWLEAFYAANCKKPIYIKIHSSEVTSATPIPSDTNFKTSITGSKTYSVFITGFSKTLINRTRFSDYVDMTIEFTEI